MFSLIDTQLASFSELKAFATANHIYVEGDRNLKQSYVDAIEDWLSDPDRCKSVSITAESIASFNFMFFGDGTNDECSES